MVAVRVAGRVWARVAVGAAAVWAGVRAAVRAAVWFPGVCGAAAGQRGILRLKRLTPFHPPCSLFLVEGS